MNEKWPFKYRSIPEGLKSVTAEEWEQIALAKLHDPQADPEDALWGVISMYCRTDRHSIALGYMEKLLTATVDPEKKASCYLSLGCIMEQVKDFQAAIGWYRRALGLEPTGSHTWYFINNNLAFCLNHFGKFTEAEPYCRTAIAIDGERHNAHKNLGICLQGQGLLIEAALCYVRAVQEMASDPRALQHLEDLVANHPWLLVDLPDLAENLHNCREVVREVRNIREARLREAEQ